MIFPLEMFFNFFVVLGISALLFAYLFYRTGSPLVAIFNRWIRWIFITFACTYIIIRYELAGHHWSILLLICFLGWFLLETLYNWWFISALNKSPIPLFPRFLSNNSGEDWPNQSQYIALREWIRRNGFTTRQSLKAEIEDYFTLRASVYDNDEEKIRLQILFLPHHASRTTTSFMLSSLAKDGTRIITDNFFLPFGGYYPENWLLVRKPRMRSLGSLLHLHRRRIQNFQEPLIGIPDEPEEDISYQQAALESLNIELGFFYPRALRSENGKYTIQGRYRVWKEIWFLNYLGRSIRYH